jgi:primary-amine oxidase
VNESAEIRPLNYIFNSGRNYVKNPLPQENDLRECLLEALPDVSDITQALLGSVSIKLITIST